MPDYVLYQIHFNADYSKVTCGWMLDWMLMVSVNPAYDYHHEEALTQYQCICYALDKPGVLTVLPGAQSIQKIEYLLKYEEQPVSVLGSADGADAEDKGVF